MGALRLPLLDSVVLTPCFGGGGSRPATEGGTLGGGGGEEEGRGVRDPLVVDFNRRRNEALDKVEGAGGEDERARGALQEAHQTGFVSGGMMKLLDAISKGKVIMPTPLESPPPTHSHQRLDP